MSELPNPDGSNSSELCLAEIQWLYGQVLSLLVYRDVLDDPGSRACLDLMDCLLRSESPETASTILQAYGQWFYTTCTADDWQSWIEQHILAADNPFTQQAQHCDLADMPQGLVDAARHDLKILQSWAIASPRLIQTAVFAKTGVMLPSLEVGYATHAADFAEGPGWAEALPALTQQYRQNGVGLLAQYRALRWHNGQLEGIQHPEEIYLSDLVGYDRQQTVLKQNTEALIAGQPALNVLLYGSRGSGKSALIKALRTAYGDRGLRLIELNKADMVYLPDVTEQLRSSALKFVIFIDDLSFEAEEDRYKALKVMLEGSLTARPHNVVVYATSNRRHLIREFFGDRPRPSNAEEIHAWDTVQEKLSLSDRFGLTLTFEPANQETYLQIVHHLANQFGVKLLEAELERQALQWAVRQNVRSGRTARQFIDYVRAQQALQS